MAARVVILGGGHGIAAVLRALRDRELTLTVIVTVADDGGSSGDLRRKWGGPAVGDIRRSLIALTSEDDSSGRALEAPVTIARHGEHPLGNLVLCSLSKAFGDLEAAGEWFTVQLGVRARVLPATMQPISLIAVAGDELIRGESAIGATSIDRFDHDTRHGRSTHECSINLILTGSWGTSLPTPPVALPKSTTAAEPRLEGRRAGKLQSSEE